MAELCHNTTTSLLRRVILAATLDFVHLADTPSSPSWKWRHILRLEPTGKELIEVLATQLFG